MQIVLSCFVSHTSSLIIMYLRIPGTNETGCLVLRNSKKILIIAFIISLVPCFRDHEYLNFILMIFNINFNMNTDYCWVMKFGVTIELKSYSNNKVKSIWNKAFRKKRIRYAFTALQNVKPCWM